MSSSRSSQCRPVPPPLRITFIRVKEEPKSFMSEHNRHDSILYLPSCEVYLFLAPVVVQPTIFPPGILFLCFGCKGAAAALPTRGKVGILIRKSFRRSVLQCISKERGL